jgi:hypothetical protein
MWPHSPFFEISTITLSYHKTTPARQTKAVPLCAAEPMAGSGDISAVHFIAMSGPSQRAGKL